ncbi:MAG: hypothetical protein N2110_07720 [Flavobacteriales bacterium]|nr:hypothetical protein [Flavobacteriales bacterium]MCX7768893.1 hypothetical protein [Flavobacteriales bacterium]MDW8410019.1 hypothetical protein [Flavobacteriales bacterium]
MKTIRPKTPHLSDTWITDKHIDLEYKSYLILGYLQSVEACFRAWRLYPMLADLIRHYRELVAVKLAAETCESGTVTLAGIDLENIRLIYEKQVPPHQLLEEILRVLEFAEPQFAESIQEGKAYYEQVEKLIHVEEVGVIPLRQDEGFVILEDQETARNRVYEYHVTLYEKPGERFKAIHTSFVADYPVGLMYHFRRIKQEILRLRPDLPTPAVYGAVSEQPLPFDETFLPIVRRLLAYRITPSA